MVHYGAEIDRYGVKASSGLSIVSVVPSGDDLIVTATGNEPALRVVQQERDRYRQKSNRAENTIQRQVQQISQLHDRDAGHVQNIRTAWSSAHGWKIQAEGYRNERDKAIVERDSAIDDGKRQYAHGYKDGQQYEISRHSDRQIAIIPYQRSNERTQRVQSRSVSSLTYQSTANKRAAEEARRSLAESGLYLTRH